MQSVKNELDLLLQSVNPEKCTIKELRKQLELKMGMDLTEHKQFIKEYTKEQLTRIITKKQEIESETSRRLAADQELAKALQEGRPSRRVAKPKKILKEKKPRKVGNTGFNKPWILSDALRAVLNETELSRPQVVKQMWAYVKKHNLQDPSDKRYIFCDEKLEAVFRLKRVNCFSMNKYLVKHLYSE